jgi:hypothetical protein
MPPKRKAKKQSTRPEKRTVKESVAATKYSAKRKNIPPAGLEAHGRVAESQKIRYEYNPHLPPILRSAKDAMDADALPELLITARQRPLSTDEAKLVADALRRHEPWLEWSGKREKPWFEVDPVALHMHERISTQAILRVLAREDVERDLFANPQHDYAKAVQFFAGAVMGHTWVRTISLGSKQLRFWESSRKRWARLGWVISDTCRKGKLLATSRNTMMSAIKGFWAMRDLSKKSRRGLRVIGRLRRQCHA